MPKAEALDPKYLDFDHPKSIEFEENKKRAAIQKKAKADAKFLKLAGVMSKFIIEGGT